MFFVQKKYTFQEINNDFESLKQKNYNEFKKRIKIVVIDDQKEHFPYKALQKMGYTIEWWDCITPENLARLEHGDFDIIFLDIKGVADDTISDSDGLGVLKRIKNVNPNQIVVAFSGQQYDLSKQEFFKLADETISKPVTLLNAEEVIDNLIENKITFQGYWQMIENILKEKGLTEKQIVKFQKLLISEIKSKSQKQKWQKIIKGKIEDIDINKIISIIDKITTIYSLLQK